MRKLVNTKLFILVALLSCAMSQLEAKNVYVSTSGSTSGEGTDPAYPVDLARFLAIFKAHTSAQGATFNAYFEPGTYTLTETLTLGAAQGGVLFVLDKKAGTSGNVTVKPANTAAKNSTGVFRSTVKDKGCNITFRNMIFDGFWGHATSATGDDTYRVFGISHNGNVLTIDHVTVRNSTDGYNLFDLRATDTGFHVFISEINIYNSSIINNKRASGYAICAAHNGNMRIYNSTFSNNMITATNNPVTYLTYADL
ncbi:MAG: hypothetical protein LBJ60_01570, partial [Tannerellaceae bacterium]|nr:hypothetical protein [Tannerellaceae bacterium]